MQHSILYLSAFNRTDNYLCEHRLGATIFFCKELIRQNKKHVFVSSVNLYMLPIMFTGRPSQYKNQYRPSYVFHLIGVSVY